MAKCDLHSNSKQSLFITHCFHNFFSIVAVNLVSQLMWCLENLNMANKTIDLYDFLTSA